MGHIITGECTDTSAVLYVHENITSANAQQLQEEAEACLASGTYTRIRFDLSDVGYISSAGLRVFLSVFNAGKRTGLSAGSFEITGVQPTVYETLEITGFTSMFTVTRAAKKVSLKNAVLIGDGFFSKVYRIDNENIVKVYNENADNESMNRELQIAKYALLLGLPTAISYDIVDADGQRGIIFEMMNCGSLRDAIRDNPDDIDFYIGQYASLLMKLHATEDMNLMLPDARAQQFTALDAVSPLLAPEENVKIRGLLESIPETDRIIHGDCHVKNIMIHNQEPFLIDLDTLSRGYPVIELGHLYYTYTAFEEMWPGNTEEFMGISVAQAEHIRDGLLAVYFAGVSPADFAANLDRIRFVCWFRMLEFLVMFKPDEQEVIQKTLTNLRTYLNRIDSLTLIMENSKK